MTAQPPLRDLTREDFEARYGCDRFTAALLVSRFRYILDHMSAKLKTNAFSFLIRDMGDFCATISGPPETGWGMPAAALTNPVHWGPVGDAVRILIEEYGVERLRPGDVLIANDSYRTGKHLNDTSFIRPIFHEGRFAGAIHVTAHQFDIGARTPGGLDVTSRTIFEDGLLITPMLLYRAGEPEPSTFALIGSNTRYPDIVLPDLEVIRAALDLGEELLAESVAKYGYPAYVGAIRYALDSAAERMTLAIAALPDGDYAGQADIESDGLPDSPTYRVVAKVIKRGPRMEIDFSGTTHFGRTAANCSWLDVKTGVLLALKMLLDPHSPPNSGTLRAVDLVVPPDSLINPRPPAATMMYPLAVQAICHAIAGALNPVCGGNALALYSGSAHLHHAEGEAEDGTPWGGVALMLHVSTYAQGASSAGDGDSNSMLMWMNYPAASIEVREMTAPLVVMRIESVTDSGGAGTHRGGCGQLSDFRYHYGGAHRGFVSHLRNAPLGAQGGGSGRLGGRWLFDPARTGADPDDWLAAEPDQGVYAGAEPLSGVFDEATHRLDPDGVFRLNDTPVRAGRHSVIRYRSNGAGGWGPPLERPAEQVLHDVRDEYVGIEGAARDYGVIIIGDPARDPEGLRIDEAATARRRAEMRAAHAMGRCKANALRLK
jgi:N-methylhydantoinase B